MMKLSGIFGTQEIIILFILVVFVGVPVFLIIWFVKRANNFKNQLKNLTKANTANEIEKLFALKEKGVITQQEFDDRKSKLLAS